MEIDLAKYHPLDVDRKPAVELPSALDIVKAKVKANLKGDKVIDRP